jgi:hypothetical protein
MWLTEAQHLEIYFNPEPVEVAIVLTATTPARKASRGRRRQRAHTPSGFRQQSSVAGERKFRLAMDALERGKDDAIHQEGTGSRPDSSDRRSKTPPVASDPATMDNPKRGKSRCSDPRSDLVNGARRHPLDLVRFTLGHPPPSAQTASLPRQPRHLRRPLPPVSRLRLPPGEKEMG